VLGWRAWSYARPCHGCADTTVERGQPRIESGLSARRPRFARSRAQLRGISGRLHRSEGRARTEAAPACARPPDAVSANRRGRRITPERMLRPPGQSASEARRAIYLRLAPRCRVGELMWVEKCRGGLVRVPCIDARLSAFFTGHCRIPPPAIPAERLPRSGVTLSSIMVFRSQR
jgi:hypothetical protein